MHHKFTESEAQDQEVFRLGRVTLKPGPRGTGAAVLPVSVQDGGQWRISGLLRITPQDIGLRRWPTSRAGRHRLIQKAIRSAREALEGRAAR